MERSPTSTSDTETNTRATRRKSGRVSNAPERLVASSAPKRKRDEADEVDEEEEDQDMDIEEDEDEEEGEADEPDAEEVRNKKRKAKRAGAAKATASKRAKTTKRSAPKKVTTKLASRPKARVKTVKKGANLDAAEDVGGLYSKSDRLWRILNDADSRLISRSLW